MDLIEVKSGQYFRHPWEIARAKGVLDLIPEANYANIADIGAGDLFFLEQFLKRFSGKALAVDKNYENSYDKVDNIQLLKCLHEITDNSLDIAFLMDVLEHEKEDKKLIVESLQKIKPGGTLVVTVPAYQHLFSLHDIHLKHYRRYNRSSLLGLIKDQGTEITESFFFFSSLYLVRLGQVIISKMPFLNVLSQNDVAGWQLAADNFLTKFFFCVLQADFKLNRSLSIIRFPTFGLSLCMILRKKSV